MTLPAPRQVLQVIGSLPWLAPFPEQDGQITAVSILIVLVSPKAASAKVSPTRTKASWPRCTRDRGPREEV